MIRPVLLVLITLFLLSKTADAGQIRTVHMNSDKMKTVNLKMGQSTVLRFSDKPRKVVIGNQNYYSIEFIENDVTIQPLGQVKTNLFIYTPHHVYGFILNPRTGVSSYDDIVNVKWVASGIVLTPRQRKKGFTEKNIGQVINLGKVKIDLRRVIINKTRGTHIVEFEVLNNSLRTLRQKDFDFYLTRSNKRLSVQEFALSNSKVLPFKGVLGRLLVKLDKKKGFTFNVKLKGQVKSKIVYRRYL